MVPSYNYKRYMVSSEKNESIKFRNFRKYSEKMIDHQKLIIYLEMVDNLEKEQ